MFSRQEFLVQFRDDEVFVYAAGHLAGGATLVIDDDTQKLEVTGPHPVKFDPQYSRDGFTRWVKSLSDAGHTCDLMRPH